MPKQISTPRHSKAEAKPRKPPAPVHSPTVQHAPPLPIKTQSIRKRGTLAARWRRPWPRRLTRTAQTQYDPGPGVFILFGDCLPWPLQRAAVPKPQDELVAICESCCLPVAGTSVYVHGPGDARP